MVREVLHARVGGRSDRNVLVRYCVLFDSEVDSAPCGLSSMSVE
jgi:hypothetical protein